MVTNKNLESVYMPFKVAVTFQNKEGDYVKIPKNMAHFSADLGNETASLSDTCTVKKD
jgi:hypothetical protein